MIKPPFLAALVLAGALLPAHASPALTEAESRWIEAGMPVVRDARERQLPVDIVVQPTDQPDASPIAMGIKDGRCMLVLSLRGNPGADTLSTSVPGPVFAAVAEAVFAHEVGHCWRYLQGVWNVLPAGFVDIGDDPDEEGHLATLRRQMRETRREEGFADLVGLAWTARSHPGDYAAVHHWLQRFRGDDTDGSHHDTAEWLRLAGSPSAFPPGDLFRQAQSVWEQGLQPSAVHEDGGSGAPSR